jgi:predicted ATP-dependent endonuclease of OLD family
VWLYYRFPKNIASYYNTWVFQKIATITNPLNVIDFVISIAEHGSYIDKKYIKPDTKIVFYYNEHTYIDLVRKTVSDNLSKTLVSIFEEYKRMRELRFNTDIGFTKSNILRENFYSDITNSVYDLTNLSAEPILIPAGRMNDFNQNQKNNTFLDFVLGDLFNNDNEQTSLSFDYLKTSILRGKVTIQQNINKDTSLEEYSPVISGKDFEISIQRASSGQQEAAGIILVIEYLLKQKTANYTIIEEPEAHLFPEAQRDLTYLISLLANQDHNQVLLTTHSPYILAALNNLMKAYTVGQMTDNESAVNDIIARELWVNPAQVFVGYMENGEISDIVNPELQQIEHDCLDNVSTDIMTKFDQLLDIQYA